MTDHGSQFYANETEARKRGESAYEKKLVELDIRHILARVKAPADQRQAGTVPRGDTAQAAPL